MRRLRYKEFVLLAQDTQIRNVPVKMVKFVLKMGGWAVKG